MNFVFAYCVMISTNQIAYSNAVQYFEDDEVFRCYVFVSPHVVYTDQKVKTSEISASRIEVTISLINIISTEQDQ